MKGLSVLLLAPAGMPQAVEWRRVIEEETGACVLATVHPGPADPHNHRSFVLLGGRETPAALRPWRLYFSLPGFLAERPFDLTLAYYLTSYGLAASFAAPGRFVAVAAGSDLYPRALVRPRLWAASRALRRSAGATAWTDRMARRMVELGASPERLLVCPRGIDLGTFSPSEGERPVRGPLRIVTTRRLRPVFRHDRLLRAVAAFVGSGRQAHLEIIGAGSEASSLRKLAAELGLTDVVNLPGALPPPEVARRLRAADVFVSLSRTDGLSTSLVEALACGVLPLVSDIEANRELIEHGQNGLVVDGDDVETIRAALERASADHVLRASARRANVAIASQRFNIRTNTRRILEAAAEWTGALPRVGRAGGTIRESGREGP